MLWKLISNAPSENLFEIESIFWLIKELKFILKVSNLVFDADLYLIKSIGFVGTKSIKFIFLLSLYSQLIIRKGKRNNNIFFISIL